VNTIFDHNTNTIVTIGPLLAVFFYDSNLAGFPALNYFQDAVETKLTKTATAPS
jgi:hypothetical protein